MTDKEQIIQLYEEMYTALINKNRATLERVHDDSFVLIHMTGMRQSKQKYINAVMDGTLNYYSATHEDMQVEVNDETAVLTGRSRVNAAVFGGRKAHMAVTAQISACEKERRVALFTGERLDLLR